MSAIARYFKAKGRQVAGYDRTASPLCHELEKEGIEITYNESVESIPQLYKDKANTLVVRTPAVPLDMAQLVWFEQEGFTVVKRARALGEITHSERGLCVAGTHGKTTTSTIMAHLIYQSHVGCNAFLGGISNNYSSNLLLSDKSDLVVIEADEYDRSFHQLSPYMSVITAADPDHLDIYGDAAGFREGFEHYTSLIRPGGALIMKKGIDVTPRLQEGVRLFTYAAEGDADFHAEHIEIGNGRICFDLHTPTETIESLELGVPVKINIENSIAAMAVAWLNGVTTDELRSGLKSYNGIYRRFNLLVKEEGRNILIDDYAHHPTELRASIGSIRALYPNRHIVGIFQPHLYTRTRDFASGFARELSELDEVILLPIYPAREQPIEGVNSELILGQLTCEKKQIVEKDALIDVLKTYKDCVVCTMGAGDIDRLVPEIARSFKS